MRSKMGGHVAGIGIITPDQDWEEANLEHERLTRIRKGCRLPTKSDEYEKMSGPVKEYRIKVTKEGE